jgi:hypothetical protein
VHQPLLAGDQDHLGVGGSAIELEDLSGGSKRAGVSPSTTGEGSEGKRHSDKKKCRKTKSSAHREAMKFSHSIQFNAVPDWSSKYISYSNLKKL